MASVPSNLSRVPNLLASQLMLANISRTGSELVRLQTQISSGSRIDTPSDDPIGASLVSILNQRLDRGAQRQRNLDHASNALATLDQTLGEVTNIALQAKTISSSQIGVGSDAATRNSQAVVIQSLIDELVRLGNTDFDGVHLFGGDRTAQPPLQGFQNGFRYIGSGSGLTTDLTPGVSAPITIGADQAFGVVSGRVKGDVDLNPTLLNTTRLADLAGALGSGVSLGPIQIAITNGPTTTITVDLTGAENVGDALDTIESAIRQADPAALGGAYPAGVAIGVTGNRIAFNVAAGVSIDITDIGAGSTAADLGLSGVTYNAGTPENVAIDLDPTLTDTATFAQLAPATAIDFGDIVFNNGGKKGTVTVNPAMTIADFKAAVERLNLGVRVEISADGKSLNALNEVSGERMSIEEAGAGTFAATTLGIRSFKPSTLIADFNDGRGVTIADGVIDPTTGLPDPNLNVDMEITLTNGSMFQVDFVPADMTTVQTVLNRINADAATAGFGGVFTATLSDAGNGILFNDTAGGGGAVTVKGLNGQAASDLGLLTGVFTAGAPAQFAGEDRATVRVDGLLTSLIELKAALLSDDTTGITLAGGGIEASVDRVAQSRALVGGRANRVENAKSREADSKLLDQTVRSRIKDLDLIEASSRFSLLQLSMQAGLTSISQAQSLSLLNFLR